MSDEITVWKPKIISYLRLLMYYYNSRHRYTVHLISDTISQYHSKPIWPERANEINYVSRHRRRALCRSAKRFGECRVQIFSQFQKLLSTRQWHVRYGFRSMWNHVAINSSCAIKTDTEIMKKKKKKRLFNVKVQLFLKYAHVTIRL